MTDRRTAQMLDGHEVLTALVRAMRARDSVMFEATLALADNLPGVLALAVGMVDAFGEEKYAAQWPDVLDAHRRS